MRTITRHEDSEKSFKITYSLDGGLSTAHVLITLWIWANHLKVYKDFMFAKVIV